MTLADDLRTMAREIDNEISVGGPLPFTVADPAAVLRAAADQLEVLAEANGHGPQEQDG